MAASVVLLQHGEKTSGSDDPGLTPTGGRQALACAHLLAGHDVVAIYCSPARRCVETARAIAKATELPVTIDQSLAERMSWVPSSALSIDEFLAEWQRATADRDYRPCVGESSRAAGTRMLAAVTRLAAPHAAGTVVCVTHGGATADLLRDLMEDEALERVAPRLIANGVPGGALTTLSSTSSGFRAIEVASTRHIPSSDRTGHDVA